MFFLKWLLVPLLFLSGLLLADETHSNQISFHHEKKSNQTSFRHGKKSAYTEYDLPPRKPFYWEWKFLAFQFPFHTNVPIAPTTGAAIGFNFTRNFSLNLGYYGTALRQGTNEIFPSSLFPNEPRTNTDGTTNELIVDYAVGLLLYPLFANTHQSTLALNLRFETEIEKFPFPPYFQIGATYSALFHRPWGGGATEFIGGPGFVVEAGVISTDPDEKGPRVQFAFSMLVSPVYENYLSHFFGAPKAWIFGFSFSAGVGGRF